MDRVDNLKSVKDQPAFSNSVKTEWIDGDKRDMRLLESLSFRDAKGRVWDAPEGSVINGASIPKFLWHLLGSPFVGRYRRATVIHDVYCQHQFIASRVVHRMFYDAMICDGVRKVRAKLMYAGVRLFGPRF